MPMRMRLVFLVIERHWKKRQVTFFGKTDEPVLVTLGAKGTYLYDDNGGRIISSDKVENVVNTIGAGDTHCGGVIAGLLNGNSFAEVCKIGNNLSAQVIQQEAGSLI